MGKRSKITHQALQSLNSQTRYGESKFDAKEKARAEAKAKGEQFKEVRGIYSTTTYSSYAKVCRQFIATTIKEHPEVKTFRDCKEFVPDFLESKMDKGCSAWTVNQYASALACAYDCRKSDFDILLPSRSRADVKRCRGINSSDYRYPEEKWDTIRMVLKATGCRRMEVLRLRREDFRTNKEGNLEVYKRGKGGIERWCLVNPKYTEQMKEWYRTAPTYRIDGEDRLVLKSELPRGSIHDCRADHKFDFALCKNLCIREELKYFMFHLIEYKKVSVGTFAEYYDRYKLLSEYINTYMLDSFSLLELVDFSHFEIFLSEKKKNKIIVKNGVEIISKLLKPAKRKSRFITFIEYAQEIIQEYYESDIPETEKLVWKYKNLNPAEIKTSVVDIPGKHLDFRFITNKTILNPIQAFCKYELKIITFSSVCNYLQALIIYFFCCIILCLQ